MILPRAKTQMRMFIECYYLAQSRKGAKKIFTLMLHYSLPLRVKGWGEGIKSDCLILSPLPGPLPKGEGNVSETEYFLLDFAPASRLSVTAPALPSTALLPAASRREREINNLCALRVLCGECSWRLCGFARTSFLPALPATNNQCRKCRIPVNTIAIPCSSAAAITSSSRMEPPG